MGNPRKPNEEHVANGTFRKDRHGSPVTARAIDLVTELPPAPDYFCEYAVEQWSALGNELVREKKLTRSELHLLASACTLPACIRDLGDVIVRRREILSGFCTAGSRCTCGSLVSVPAWRYIFRFTHQ